MQSSAFGFQKNMIWRDWYDEMAFNRKELIRMGCNVIVWSRIGWNGVGKDRIGNWGDDGVEYDGVWWNGIYSVKGWDRKGQSGVGWGTLRRLSGIERDTGCET